MSGGEAGMCGGRVVSTLNGVHAAVSSASLLLPLMAAHVWNACVGPRHALFCGSHLILKVINKGVVLTQVLVL